MKKSELIEIIRQQLREANVTGTGSTFSPGAGAQYATPFAFGKDKRAKKTLKKQGYKEI